jgi:hypothetical protein
MGAVGACALLGFILGRSVSWSLRQLYWTSQTFFGLAASCGLLAPSQIKRSQWGVYWYQHQKTQNFMQIPKI